MEYVFIMLLVGAVIAMCVFVNRVTDKVKVPSLLLFIGIGMAFGVLLRVAGQDNFTDYDLGNVVCSICLVVVIFSGGFGTNFKEARPVAGRALLLSFAGTAFTAGLVGVGVYSIFQLLPFFPDGIGWIESFLVGSVIASTDAASVFNILRSRRLNLKYHTSSLLEMESGSNDPMSYMLTVVFVALLAAKYGVSGAQAMSAGEIVGMLASQVGFGALFGVAFAMRGIAKLQCSGNVVKGKLVGSSATVYVSIPERRSGRGKITVTAQGRYMEIDAVTDGGRIPVDTVVEICEYSDDFAVVRPGNGTEESVPPAGE